MHRQRHAKIVATLGPASSDAADHPRALRSRRGRVPLQLQPRQPRAAPRAPGHHAAHRAGDRAARSPSCSTCRGPSCASARFADGPVTLDAGDAFRLDLDADAGHADARAAAASRDLRGARSPAPTCCSTTARSACACRPAARTSRTPRVIAGGIAVGAQGRQRAGGAAADLGADGQGSRATSTSACSSASTGWRCRSCSGPRTCEELRDIVQGRAGVLAKLEKPAAIERLDAIVALSDAVMVARGDLGVEMPAEQVPRIQKRIVRACRDAGKPVIVATQMLESMISAPVPTRAEASDVATAIYDGADAVMLSAESASGQYPREAVAMMDRIIAEVEARPALPRRDRRIAAAHRSRRWPMRSAASLRQTASLVPVAAMVTYTRSGYTSLRAARERPVAPVLSITPELRRRAPPRAGLGRASGACAARRQRRAEHGARRPAPLARDEGYAQARRHRSSSPPACRSARPARPTCCTSRTYSAPSDAP